VRKKLVLTDGVRERELQLVGRMVVGRDPACEISHDHSLLSRRHAEFVTAGDVVTVRDLGSRNGVFVNGSRAAEQVLEAGDIVQIGPLRARYLVEQAPNSITPEDLDADRTAVIRKAFAAAVEAPIPLAVAGALSDDEDQDVTRMLPAPRLPSQAAQAARLAQAAVTFDDDAPTQFVSAPDSTDGTIAASGFDGDLRLSPASTGPATTPDPLESGAPVVARDAGLRTVVFVHLLLFAAVILAASAIPVIIWRQAISAASAVAVPSLPIAWLALAAAVVIAGTYLTGSALNRRIEAAAEGADRRRSGGR
jgi:predicted component of type VI protein secretion system